MHSYNWHICLLEQLCIYKSHHKLINEHVYLLNWLRFVALFRISLFSVMCQSVLLSQQHCGLRLLLGKDCLQVLLGIITIASSGPVLIAYVCYNPRGQTHKYDDGPQSLHFLLCL